MLSWDDWDGQHIDVYIASASVRSFLFMNKYGYINILIVKIAILKKNVIKVQTVKS